MNVRTLRSGLAPAFAALALLVGAHGVWANPPVTLTLKQAATTVAPGGTFEFTGTVTDHYAPFSFGGDSLNPIGSWPAGLTLDDTPFLTDAPATLAPNASYTGGLFDVSVARGTPLGTYDGTFQVEYDDGSGTPYFATEGFQIHVAAIPEASSVVSSGLLLALGGAAAFGAARRRKGRASA